MKYSATIDGGAIIDWDSFHSEFEKKLGFFDGYGRNMDAWIDCMRDLYTNDEYKSLTKFDLNPNDTFDLIIENAANWKHAAPDVFAAFEECSALCNRDDDLFIVHIGSD